jgi:hypothetical protein
VTTLLRWLSPDPPATVVRLRSQLGVAGRTEPAGPDGDQRIELDRLTIEVVRADDRPNGAPADERLELVRQPASARKGPRHSSRPESDVPRLVAMGWATVEIERFAADLGSPAIPCPNDVILGAFAASVAGDPPLVLLEPENEGRLVASLAHWGEGPVALYLAADGTTGGLAGVAARLRAIGFHATAIAPGPFGPELAIVGSPVRGPHVLFCERGGSRDPGRPSSKDALR